MASAAARSGLRSLAARAKPAAPARRRMSSSVHDDAHETAKWEKITYAGIATCTLLAAYNLSKGHPHFDEPPAYPYLHIRNKEFPWGEHYNESSKHQVGMSGDYSLESGDEIILARNPPGKK